MSESPKQPHLILLQVKLDYIPDILPKTGCPAKLAFRLQRRSKLAKSAIFGIFDLTVKLFIVEEKFCLLKIIFQQAASFPFFDFFCDDFQPNYCKTTARSVLFLNCK